jgi:hypothetical protein
MRRTSRRRYGWLSRIPYVSIGSLLFLGGYLTALWVPWPRATLPSAVQAAESHKEHTHHQHTAHEVDLTPFMIRNAYHFATLYHAARAERWELAAHEAEALADNITQAAQAGGSFAPFLKDFLQDYVPPLQEAIAGQHAARFRTAFQAAVSGCNDCHKATRHAFITVPQEPPALAIFVFPPAGK